jgi:hypothetical protein
MAVMIICKDISARTGGIDRCGMLGILGEVAELIRIVVGEIKLVAGA